MQRQQSHTKFIRLNYLFVIFGARQFLLIYYPWPGQTESNTKHLINN